MNTYNTSDTAMSETTKMQRPQLSLRRSLRFVVVVSGFLSIFYISMTAVGFRNDANASGFWSTLDNVTSSVFVPQYDATASPNRVVHGLGLIEAEMLVHTGQRKCPGRENSDEFDRKICHPLIAGETYSNMRPNFAYITGAEYAQLTQPDNCECFRSDLGYFVSPEDTTEEERQFPIAFSLLTYENLEQTERLLRLIYRPHNIYCIHVDAKTSAEFYEKLEAIANCLDNVFLARPPISVYWGKISIVHAELLCMRRLLQKHKRWKYFINLVGRDFPLRTNYELVKILKAYDGANDVLATRNPENHFFPDWFENKWNEQEVRGELKTKVPHEFDVAKGSTHMAVTREFVEYAVSDPKARDLLYWMRDIKVPDEHYFQTLSHSPHMDIPGSFIGDPDLKKSFVRAKHWSFLVGEESVCRGQWVRWICNVGVRDLPWVTASPHMFVNKIRIKQDPKAFRCLELWYRDRVRRQQRLLATGTDNFNVSIYASQPFVRYHVPSSAEHRLVWHKQLAGPFSTALPPKPTSPGPPALLATRLKP